MNSQPLPRIFSEPDHGEGRTMLRGLSTMNLWAEDLAAATRWYTELLGVEPYFTSEAAGRGSCYVEFRIGDYEHEPASASGGSPRPSWRADQPGWSSTGMSMTWRPRSTGWCRWAPSSSSRSPSRARGS